MNTLLARSAIAKTLVSLFVLIAVAGAQTYSILTSFDGTNGYEPFATPLIDSFGQRLRYYAKRRRSQLGRGLPRQRQRGQQHL
jgi:hypothetical protein